MSRNCPRAASVGTIDGHFGNCRRDSRAGPRISFNPGTGTVFNQPWSREGFSVFHAPACGCCVHSIQPCSGLTRRPVERYSCKWRPNQTGGASKSPATSIHTKPGISAAKRVVSPSCITCRLMRWDPAGSWTRHSWYSGMETANRSGPQASSCSSTIKRKAAGAITRNRTSPSRGKRKSATKPTWRSWVRGEFGIQNASCATRSVAGLAGCAAQRPCVPGTPKASISTSEAESAVKSWLVSDIGGKAGSV